MSARAKVLADLYLGYRAVLVHPLRRLFARGPRGKQKFLANYAGEGLLPTTAADRAWLAAAGRCISCGLCDQVDGLLKELPADLYDGVSLLPRQLSRSSIELAAASAALRHIEPEAYREAEAICPTSVPLVGLARWLKERALRVEAQRVAYQADQVDRFAAVEAEAELHEAAERRARATIRSGPALQPPRQGAARGLLGGDEDV